MSSFLDPKVTRREMLVGGMAATLSLAGAVDAFAAADDDFAGFTVGVQSYCFRKFDLEPALKRTKDLGLHNIEFYQKHAPLQSSPKQIKALV